jgi:hypothetical protein
MNSTRFFPTLYVDITDPVLSPLTEEQVRGRLTSKGYIGGGVIEDITILDPDLRKVEYKERDSSIEPGLPVTYSFDGIYLEEGTAINYVDTIVDTIQLRHNAVSNRTKRNKILESTDWIEASAAVTTETKSAYKAYRQLLRDIFSVIDETNYLVLPTAPEVVMKPTKEVEIKQDIVQKLKNYVPDKVEGWNIFLKEWSLLNFTPNKAIITNLLAAYTNTTFSVLSKQL